MASYFYNTGTGSGWTTATVPYADSNSSCDLVIVYTPHGRIEEKVAPDVSDDDFPAAEPEDEVDPEVVEYPPPSQPEGGRPAALFRPRPRQRNPPEGVNRWKARSCCWRTARPST